MSDYRRGELSESAAGDDPIRLFATWIERARDEAFEEPSAMALGTCDGDGRPSVRMVLLKGFDSRGFVFFTNLGSRKGRELAANPRAALTLWWDRLERQVRIEGAIERVDDAEADAGHASRPRGSRLAAWASPQSEPIEDRDALLRRYAEIEARFPGEDVPRPAGWGGFRVVPETIEFWQGRSDRLHDRIVFRREPGGGWKRERLAP